MRLNLVEYVVANTDYNQTQLAQYLEVSPQEVCKWKQDSLSIIPERQRKALFDLVGLFGDDLEWAILTKTEENARAWVAYMAGMDDEGVLNEVSDDEVESTRYVLTLFQEYGFNVPGVAPEVPADEDYYLYNNRYSFSRLIFSFLCKLREINCWMNTVEPYGEVEFDDVWMDLRARKGEVALRFIDDEELLIQNGVDVAKKQIQDEKEKVRLRLAIQELCEVIVSKNFPIYHDYYWLVQATCTEDLLDPQLFWSAHDSVEKHLPWAERLKIELLRTNLNMTADLLKRIDVPTGKNG